MEKQNIGVVNILDARHLTEDNLAAAPKIGVANVILHTQQNAHLISRLEVGVVNVTVEAPDKVEFQTLISNVTIDKTFFGAHLEPVNLLVIGSIFVASDVTEEDIQNGIGAMVAIGNLVCPENLRGALLRKSIKIIGSTKAYPPFKLVKLHGLTLDEDYLNSIPDGSELAVIGSLNAPDALPAGLFERKVAKLFVSGSILCHAEDLAALQARLVHPGEKFTTIPAGTTLVEKHLTLDAETLSVLPVRRLYVQDWVLIDKSVSAAQLDERLDALTSEEMIVCPAALKESLARKTNVLKQRVIFYEGELWMFDAEHTLYPARFAALEGQATMLVTGDLIVDAQVDPAEIKARLVKVHNLGTILCSREQMMAIEARLGIREGHLDELREAEQEEKDESGAGVFNFLEL